MTQTSGCFAALMPAWQAREMAIVQGIGYSEGTQQHFRDIDTAFTGYDGRDFSNEGWVTRALAKHARAAMPDAIAFDVLDIRLADPMGPFRGDKLGVVQVYHAADLLNSRRLAASAHETTTRARQQLATPGQPLGRVPLKTRFADEPFGQAIAPRRRPRRSIAAVFTSP